MPPRHQQIPVMPLLSCVLYREVLLALHRFQDRKMLLLLLCSVSILLILVANHVQRSRHWYISFRLLHLIKLDFCYFCSFFILIESLHIQPESYCAFIACVSCFLCFHVLNPICIMLVWGVKCFEDMTGRVLHCHSYGERRYRSNGAAVVFPLLCSCISRILFHWGTLVALVLPMC